MDISLILIIVVATAIWFWLTILGCIAAKYDSTLNEFQSKAQIAVSILVPYFGAVLVLYLVSQHSPDVIPRKWIPWPFSLVIFGKQRARNKNRDNNENNGIDLAISDSQHSDTGSGGDGGD